MVVLDTSVIIKWFVQEEDTDEALVWRDKHLEGKEIILVPSLLFYEVANVLRYNLNLPQEKIFEIIDLLFDVELQVEEVNRSLILQSIELARNKNISVYDAVYIILAQKWNCDFITADYKLLNRVKGLKIVKLL